ncbi:MAG: DNA polymerase III subunit delta' C-terminal domain-containing protein [Clostridia bacterium]
MNFNKVIGQKEILLSLKKSIANDTVGHAYIFSGPRGIGKRTVASIFSAMLLCSETISDDGGIDSCGKCYACRMFSSEANPDYKVIEPTGTSIKIEEARKIHSDVSIRPTYSKRKVYVINEAEKMTKEAQNSLLKILEEPPKYVTIILTTSNYTSLLETVRSRAVKFEFKKNEDSEVKNILKTDFSGNIKGADFIASYSNGIIGTAIKLAGSEDFIKLREETLGIINRLNSKNLLDVFEIYPFFNENKPEINTILDIMAMFYRDLLVTQSAGDGNLLINSDKKDIILVNAKEYKEHELIKNIEIIEVTRKYIMQNVNYQLCIEVMLMKIQEEND